MNQEVKIKEQKRNEILFVRNPEMIIDEFEEKVMLMGTSSK